MKIAVKSSWASAAAAIVFALGLGSPAHAEYTFSVQQVGPDVVVTGSGTLNTTALTMPGAQTAFGANGAMTSVSVITGACGGAVAVRQFTGMTGPTSLPVSTTTLGSSGSGDCVAFTTVLNGGPSVWIPSAWTPGDPFSSTNTFSGQTLASMGLTPGTYVWSWGSGPTADRYILRIGPPPVPTMGEWSLIALASLLAASGLFAAAMQARRRRTMI
ncbi:hypothetical protein ACETK8_13605 [Brevundimonas staleyi]|uniref:IPTL-CTERM protein sorting domain-containing protein n=1 Tax=Brevundimonas staleyi TaxID=74326 RepID=A0ABW0FL84_9CAUL